MKKKEIEENTNKNEKNRNEVKQDKKKVLDIVKDKKKVITIFVILIMIVIITIVLIKLLFIPLFNYNKANDYLEKGNYIKAIKLFENYKDYKDSNDKIKEAYYEYGISLIDEEKYEDAITMFKNAKGDSLEKYISYANAMIDFNDQKYNTALSAFKDLSDFKSSKDYVNYSNLMLAEEQYKKGNLVSAKKMFSDLDKDLEFNDLKVSDRLEILEKYKDYVNLCGIWTGTNGKFSVRQTHDSTGLWDQWDNQYNAELNLKCIINEDGTVTLKGDAKYYIFTNYSSLSQYLKTPQKSLSINKTVSSIPSEIATGTNVRLTYSGGKFSLVYDYKDANSSMYFTYRYKSSITYNTRKAA